MAQNSHLATATGTALAPGEGTARAAMEGHSQQSKVSQVAGTHTWNSFNN